MKPYTQQIVDLPKTLSIAVTFPGTAGKQGPVACNRAGIAPEESVDTRKRNRAIDILQEAGFEISGEGKMTVSIRGSRRSFERVFRTKLATETMVEEIGPMTVTRKFFAPPQLPDEDWQGSDTLADLIDDAYIQWPHIYMNQRFDRAPNSSPTVLVMDSNDSELNLQGQQLSVL